jgi:NAD(P)-dependent dehydrogenase (short-subunit alcohol dehydrogenase family)
MSKVWFITGAGSGIGTGIAKAALEAGDSVVATGRNLDKVRNAYRDVAGKNIAFVQLDVVDEAQAKAAVEEAVMLSTATTDCWPLRTVALERKRVVP